MKNIVSFSLFLILINISSNAQISIYDGIRTGQEISKNEKKKDKLYPKLVQTLEFDISLPQTTRYSVFDGEGGEIRNRLSFDLFYSINYPIIKKLTIGIITGLQHQSQGSLTAVKVGGVLRYYFKNYDSGNFYFMTARGFGISDKIRNSAGYGNARFGLQFPIEKLSSFDDFNITFTIFWDNDSYALKKPLFGDEVPHQITFHGGYGIGIGVKF